jgi:hypothetical protein
MEFEENSLPENLQFEQISLQNSINWIRQNISVLQR